MARFDDIDFSLLEAFAVTAQTRNIRKAAELLHLSQPPLSRKIQKLEECLGYALFTRHSKGLELTGEGSRALALIQPLLALRRTTLARLVALAQPAGKIWRIGLTTAFEHGLFERLGQGLCARLACRFARISSPKLVHGCALGRLDAAFIALPAATGSLPCRELAHAEEMVAVIPAAWAQGDAEDVALADLAERPLFWFQRAANPAWFDVMAAAFRQLAFAPSLTQEPAEHDVLLARIAAGEAFALMPASFARIQRDGLRFLKVRDPLPRLRLGLVFRDEAAMADLAPTLAVTCPDWLL